MIHLQMSPDMCFDISALKSQKENIRCGCSQTSYGKAKTWRIRTIRLRMSYRLRSTLACIGIRDLIQASHGTFTLNPNYTIFTDVERFDDACKRIDNSSDPAILQALYESIIGLYRGSLLPRYDFLPLANAQNAVLPKTSFCTT